jgi:hypothetical protein
VDFSDTESGFKRLSGGETDISDETHPIEANQQKFCDEVGVGSTFQIPVLAMPKTGKLGV